MSGFDQPGTLGMRIGGVVNRSRVTTNAKLIGPAGSGQVWPGAM